MSGAQSWSLGGLAAVVMGFSVLLMKGNRDPVSCICSLPQENTERIQSSINPVEGFHKVPSTQVS